MYIPVISGLDSLQQSNYLEGRVLLYIPLHPGSYSELANQKLLGCLLKILCSESPFQTYGSELLRCLQGICMPYKHPRNSGNHSIWGLLLACLGKASAHNRH